MMPSEADGTVIRTHEPEIPSAYGYMTYEIWVDGALLDDDASAGDVIAFFRERIENFPKER